MSGTVVFGPVSAVRILENGRVAQDLLPGGEGMYAWQGASLVSDQVRLAAGIGGDFDSFFGEWMKKNPFDSAYLVPRTDYCSYCEADAGDRETNPEKSVYGIGAGKFYYAESILYPQQFLHFLHDTDSVILCEKPEIVSLEALRSFRSDTEMALCWIVPERMRHYGREEFEKIVNRIDLYGINADTAAAIFGTSDERELLELLTACKKPFYFMGSQLAWFSEGGSCTGMEWEKKEGLHLLGCEYTAAAAAMTLFCRGADPYECCKAGRLAYGWQGEFWGLIPDITERKEQMYRELYGERKRRKETMITDDYLTGLVRQARISHGIAREIFSHFDEQTLRVIPSAEIHRTQKIILTGCGDSFCAAIYAKSLFERITKIETHAVRCIDLARHIDTKEMGYAPVTPLVIGISVSGNVTRVAEALQTAVKYGANTLALTDHPEAPVGKAAQHTLAVGLPSWGEYRPGANNYTGILIALTCLAFRFGRATGTLSADVYGDMRKAIGDYLDAFEERRPELEQQAFELAKTWKDLDSYEFIGDDADYATAFMNSAKCHETFGGYTGCCTSGDWLESFACKKNPGKIGRVVVANQDTPSFDCLKRTIDKIVEKGSPCLVISDSPASEFNSKATVITTPKPRYHFLAPILQHYPFDMTAGFMAAGKGFKEILRLTLPEFDNPVAVDSNRIRNSEIVLL